MTRLIGGKICKDIACMYIYDTKSVYFLSNACRETKWVENHRQAYNNQEKSIQDEILLDQRH